MSRIRLLSTNIKIIRLFEETFSQKGEFYDSFDENFPKEDLIIWDTTSVSPEPDVFDYKVIGLYLDIQKGQHFFAVKNRFRRWERVPETTSALEEISIAPQTAITAKEQLQEHYSYFLDSHIQNYLKLPNGSDVLKRLWNKTQERFEKDIPLLKQLVEQNNFIEINRVAHKNKSTCGNAGCWRLHVLCHWIELAAARNLGEMCQKLVVENLNTTYNETLKAWPNP